MGLNEVISLKYHFEHSAFPIAAGAWLTVKGIREYQGQLQEVEIEIKITDGFGGYLDTKWTLPLLNNEEKEFVAKEPIKITVSDTHPRNLPPEGIDLAPKPVPTTEARPFVSIFTPLPVLMWSDNFGFIDIKIKVSKNLHMWDSAVGFANPNYLPTDAEVIQFPSPEALPPEFIFIRISYDNELAETLRMLFAQDNQHMNLALQISGKSYRTDRTYTEADKVLGTSEPTEHFGTYHNINFGSDVKLRVLTYPKTNPYTCSSYLGAK